MYRHALVRPGSSWGRNDGWCGKEIGSENVEWIRLAQDRDLRHSNLQLKAMQFVVTACCIATRKVAELFGFSSARRSGGSGVQPAGVVGGRWQPDYTSMGCRAWYVERGLHCPIHLCVIFLTQGEIFAVISF